MVLSIVLCVCIILIFIGFSFFMETEGSWKFVSVFSGDEKDEHTAKPDVTVARKGCNVAVVAVPESGYTTEETYRNMTDCRILSTSYEVTPFGMAPHCSGYGSCIQVCPNHAISLQKGKAVIGENCNGCGLCIESCPMHLISLVPQSEETEKKRSFRFNFWKFWYTILRRDETDGSIALWE